MDEFGVVPDYEGTSEEEDDGATSSASFQIIKEVDLSVYLSKKKKQQIVVCTNNASKSVTPPADAGNMDSQLIPKKKPDDNPNKCDDNTGKKSSNEKPQCNPPKYTRHSSLIDKKPCQNPQIPTRGNNCWGRNNDGWRNIPKKNDNSKRNNNVSADCPPKKSQTLLIIFVMIRIMTLLTANRVRNGIEIHLKVLLHLNEILVKDVKTTIMIQIHLAKETIVIETHHQILLLLNQFPLIEG